MENQITEEGIFQKSSKLVARSPTKETNDQAAMDQILKAIQGLRSEMIDIFNKTNEQRKNQRRNGDD